MDTLSLWKHISTKPHSYPSLTENIEVDVAIVGGGITGITAALQLLNAGQKVAILEAHEIGGSTTGFSTGNLYVPIQPYFQGVFAKFDFETVKKVANSRKETIDRIEEITKKYHIDCNFTRRPMYIFADKDKSDFLRKEYELLKKADIDLSYTDNLPYGIKSAKAFVLENQARFNPLQYVISLAEQLHKQGCHIFENTRVMQIEEKNNRCIFKTSHAQVIAKKGIIATHTPTGINSIQLYTAPYRSYVIAVELQDHHYPEMNTWNIQTPHYAMSTHSMSKDKPDLLVIAGSHHRTGQASNSEAHYQELEKYLKQHFNVKAEKYRWSAQHYHAADDLPYIGLASHYENIYEATGYFADGLVYGSMAGIILGDKILQKTNTWSKIYNTKRHKFWASLGFLISNYFNILLQYFKDMPAFSKKDYHKIKAGEGKVCVISGKKCGIYRDSNEKLHIVSAVCTHMKCIVNWNNAEKTWDCPCHGSRFTFEGKVIEGPARQNLSKIKEQ